MKNSEIHTANYKYLVFDCQRITKLDFTAAKVRCNFLFFILHIYFQCLSVLISDLKKMDKEVIFYRPHKSVGKIMSKVTEGGLKIAETDEKFNEILKGIFL